MHFNKVTVIIPTYNEEKNIEFALRSVQGWAHRIIIIDSFSTDNTLEKCKSYQCEVFQNKFFDYSQQTNFALTQISIDTEWIFWLDADEWLPDCLKEEISQLILTNPKENGFYVNYRLIWMGRWIKRGYYPNSILRLFRNGKAQCELRPINQHLIIEGKLGQLNNDFIHEDRKGISNWIEKHNRYTSLEAKELLKGTSTQYIDAKLFGTRIQRKRWVIQNIWTKLPILLRPFLYFSYRYFATGAFLEGKASFTFHFLQGLWAQMLIGIKFLELTNHSETPS